MKNRVCEILGIQYPIVQAAMNWITDAEIAGAVSNAGGLGVLGPNSGEKYADGRKLSTEERYRNEIHKLQSITDKPFAVNIVSRGDERDQYFIPVIRLCLEEGVRIFVVVGTVNEQYFKMIKDAGATIIYREITPTPEDALRAQELGADIIIATGFDEGGELPHNAVGTFSIVPIIADAVSVPVMAAGGINDIRGVRAAFALGAEGIYVGSRFAVSKECPLSDNSKADIVTAKSTDLVFIGQGTRALKNAFVEELIGMMKAGTPANEIMARIATPEGEKPGLLKGDRSRAIMSVNTAVDLIRDVKSCEEIVQELMADFIQEN